MAGDIEERIQIYSENDESAKITTRRRYVSKQQACDLLEKTGYGDIRLVDGYELRGIHRPGKDETTRKSFVCVANS